LSAEHLCQLYAANYGVPAVLLRYFSVYGPRQRPDMALTTFLRAALRDQPVTVFGDGRQTRDFTYVEDVVRATLAAAASPAAVGGIYNVGGGSQISVASALQVLEQVVGRKLDVRRLPPQEGDVRHTGADTTRARRDLGFEPGTDFAEGLHAQLDWLLAGEREGRAGAAR